MPQALNPLLHQHHHSNQLQVNHATGMITPVPTSLTPTISTSLTPGLTTTSLTPRFNVSVPTPTPTPGVIPTNTMATSLGTGVNTTSLLNHGMMATSQTANTAAFNPGILPPTSLASAAPSSVPIQTGTSQMRLPVGMSNSLLQAMTQAALASGVPPPLNMGAPPPYTQTATHTPQTTEGSSMSLSGGVMPQSNLATGLTPTSPPSLPPSLLTPTSLPPNYMSNNPTSLTPTYTTTSVPSRPPPRQPTPPQQMIHKPPPGFSPRPDPAAVSAQLAQLDMRQNAVMHNTEGNLSRDNPALRQSAFVRVPSDAGT